MLIVKLRVTGSLLLWYIFGDKWDKYYWILNKFFKKTMLGYNSCTSALTSSCLSSVMKEQWHIHNYETIALYFF